MWNGRLPRRVSILLRRLRSPSFFPVWADPTSKAACSLCGTFVRICRRSGNQAYFLASAVYAFAFLFPEDPGAAPKPYDPRLRLAVDLYNQGIASGLATKDGSEVDFSERTIALPFGSLDLRVAPDGLHWGGYQVNHFVPLSDLEARGLRNHYRKPGIGIALSAQAVATTENHANQWIAPKAKVPVTAFVRFEDPRRQMSEGKVRGTIEFYDVGEVPAVGIGAYTVGLESDPTLV